MLFAVVGLGSGVLVQTVVGMLGVLVCCGTALLASGSGSIVARPAKSGFGPPVVMFWMLLRVLGSTPPSTCKYWSLMFVFVLDCTAWEPDLLNGFTVLP